MKSNKRGIIEYLFTEKKWIQVSVEQQITQRAGCIIENDEIRIFLPNVYSLEALQFNITIMIERSCGSQYQVFCVNAV